jgi:hypothetical protein
MLKLPRTIHIGGIKFAVDIRDLPHWGEMDFDNKRISISRKALQEERLAVETLRHEMTHAALHVSGVSFSESYDDETVVRAIDNILFPAWEHVVEWLKKHNPHLK